MTYKIYIYRKDGKNSMLFLNTHIDKIGDGSDKDIENYLKNTLKLKYNFFTKQKVSVGIGGVGGLYHAF